MTKIISHSTVYHNPQEYASFPSLALHPDGDLYCVFRLVPSRKDKTHINTHSIAVLMKSTDEGETWEKVSQISSLGEGIQDPSIYIDSDQFLINYFTWHSRTRKHTKKAKNVRMLGCFVRRSRDAQRWYETFRPFAWGHLSIAVSEPAIILDGLITVAGYTDIGGGGDACLLVGEDCKTTKIAHDPTGKLNFQEPALLNLGDNHLLCLMRVPTESGSAIYQAHSWDGGETWQPPRATGIQGLPPNLCLLRNGDVLCTYGCRKKPYGIRACVSRDDGLTWQTHKEIILSTDGGGWDIGYPSTVQLPDGDLMTAYYWYTKKDKTRRIEVKRWKLK